MKNKKKLKHIQINMILKKKMKIEEKECSEANAKNKLKQERNKNSCLNR